MRPQIADGDRLILDYQVSLSSFVGESVDPAVPPPRQENTLHSIVTIPDGHTVVVGGLEVETLSDGASQVPVLGSIPLVGALFRSSSTTTRNRFYVFLRCTVMRSVSFDDLKYVSRVDLDKAELDDGWPVLEPQVMRSGSSPSPSFLIAVASCATTPAGPYSPRPRSSGTRPRRSNSRAKRPI